MSILLYALSKLRKTMFPKERTQQKYHSLQSTNQKFHHSSKKVLPSKSLHVYQKLASNIKFDFNSVRISGKTYYQQYERVQQNSRIVKRIVSPKRDKIIIKSTQIIKQRKQLRTAQKSRSKKREGRNFQSSYTESQIKEKPLLMKATYQYDLRIENERMGKRILNSKSIVRSLNQQDYQNKNKNQEAKMNEGVHAFFIKNQPHTEDNTGLYAINIKQVYGYGPTIVTIKKISLKTVPQIKSQDLMCLQLMVPNKNPRMYRTCLIPYELLTKTTLKFAVRLKMIGQYIPLRIWKIRGVENIQIGIVDIQICDFFQPKYQKVDQKRAETGDKKSRGMQRVVQQKISCNLRRQRVEEAKGKIQLEYLICCKKYL